MAIEGGKI